VESGRVVASTAVAEPSDHASALASAFLAGPWRSQELKLRGREVFGKTPRWLGRLADGVVEVYHRAPADRPRELAQVIDALLAERRIRAIPPVRRWQFFEPEMGRMRWAVRPIATVGELGDFVEADPGHLAWIADTRGLERSAPSEQLRNYRYTWDVRTHATARVLERPKYELKRVQRLILREILDAIPPHEAAHGFRRGRSVVTHAAAHTGNRVVLRFDLESFFASVDGGRVFGIFRAAGYPERVAYVLTALCVNVVPRVEWASVPVPGDPGLLDAHRRLGRRLATPHLPQGAPTSPALASLVALGLDRRLTGLAARFDATYTRYADDLAFSGGARLLAGAHTAQAAVAAIARDEGFAVNRRKTRLMTNAGRQKLCGVVVNRRPNVARRDYDTLKAIVHNAAQHGPAGQDRASLLGRIAWVESVHRERGARLRREFDRIDWPG
jgi:RNA-directed DNA polymerase